MIAISYDRRAKKFTVMFADIQKYFKSANPPPPPHTHTYTGLKRKPLALIKRLRKAKKEAPPMEKPAVVKTHLRNMIVVPEMIGSVVGVHNGKTFNQVEIKVNIFE